MIISHPLRLLHFLRGWIAAWLLLPYAVSYGDRDGGGRILVHNGTPYYLHVIINETPYLYVRPGHWVRESSVSGSVDLRAFYAPAQGVESSADTVLQITETTTSTVKNDCGQSPDCEKTTEASTSYSSATWEVTPELMNGGGR